MVLGVLVVLESLAILYIGLGPLGLANDPDLLTRSPLQYCSTSG